MKTAGPRSPKGRVLMFIDRRKDAITRTSATLSMNELIWPAFVIRRGRYANCMVQTEKTGWSLSVHSLLWGTTGPFGWAKRAANLGR